MCLGLQLLLHNVACSNHTLPTPTAQVPDTSVKSQYTVLAVHATAELSTFYYYNRTHPSALRPSNQATHQSSASSAAPASNGLFAPSQTAVLSTLFCWSLALSRLTQPVSDTSNYKTHPGLAASCSTAAQPSQSCVSSYSPASLGLSSSRLPHPCLPLALQGFCQDALQLTVLVPLVRHHLQRID